MQGTAVYLSQILRLFYSTLFIINSMNYTRAQLSQRKPIVAFVCYWQTDDIHTFCDLGNLKLIVAVCAKRGKIMVRY